MAYTTIDKPTDYFNTVLYTGNATARSITGVGFQPDWLWIKKRSESGNHRLVDSIRGATKELLSDATDAEATTSGQVTSFDSDGFSLGTSNSTNKNTITFVAWNWKAGGSAPAITYTVKVVSDSGNKYRFDDFGTSAVTLDLQEGGTYTFDQSDSSNSGHPLRFSTTSNGTHGGGSEYTTGVTTTGTPGSAGAKTVITVSASAPTLYYYCTQHSGMGGQANTNSTFGSSNFAGSIQSTVSAGSTQGFSIVSYTSNGSASQTVGHGLGAVPQMIISKNRDSGSSSYNYWTVYHHSLATANDKKLKLNTTDAESTTNEWGDTDPTSTVYSIHTGGDGTTNHSSDKIIAYCFAEKKGYSKFGSYTGNGNADGPFVYTGFKPAWVLIKVTSTTNDWEIHDNKRQPFNEMNAILQPNLSDAETPSSQNRQTDFLSNGFKLRNGNTQNNLSGGSFIYMAFAESPFVNSNGIPNNAR
jgi:hypothetical protein